MFTVNVSVLFFRIFEFFWVFFFKRNITNATCCWAWLFMKFEKCPPGMWKSGCNCHHLHLTPFSDETQKGIYLTMPQDANSAASACIDRLDSELSARNRRQLPCVFSRKEILPLESFRLPLPSVKSWSNLCALLPTFRDTTVLVGDVSLS